MRLCFCENRTCPELTSQLVLRTHPWHVSLFSCLRALPELRLDVTGTCLLLFASLEGRRDLSPEV